MFSIDIQRHIYSFGYPKHRELTAEICKLIKQGFTLYRHFASSLIKNSNLHNVGGYIYCVPNGKYTNKSQRRRIRKQQLLNNGGHNCYEKFSKPNWNQQLPNKTLLKQIFRYTGKCPSENYPYLYKISKGEINNLSEITQKRILRKSMMIRLNKWFKMLLLKKKGLVFLDKLRKRKCHISNIPIKRRNHYKRVTNKLINRGI